MSREFLGQGWMKVDKNERTPYIMKTSQHFNDVSTIKYRLLSRKSIDTVYDVWNKNTCFFLQCDITS